MKNKETKIKYTLSLQIYSIGSAGAVEFADCTSAEG